MRQPRWRWAALWAAALLQGAYTQGQALTAGYLEVGVNGLDNRTLDAALRQAGYPELGALVPAAGFALTHIQGRLVLGGNAYGYMRRQPYAGGRQTVLLYNYATGRIGVVLAGRGSTYCYLLAGAGYAGGRLLRYENTFSSATDRRAHGLLLDAALHLNQFKPFPDDDRNYLVLGAALGWQHTLGTWAAEVQPGTPTGIPLRGPYMRLHIGMASGNSR